MTEPDPNELVRRAAAGDRAALETFWREQRRFVAAVLLAHGVLGADLEDLLQEVALSVCEHISNLREPERFRPWLRSIALNRARSAWRREIRRRQHTQPLRPEHGPTGVPDPSADSHADRILEILRKLKPEYGEPLILKALRGFTQSEIAAALELPETTVETRLVRARKLLRTELERDGGAPAPARERSRPSRRISP
jgi:RNA polymerase sigma-70 factor (ECF subfamily)